MARAAAVMSAEGHGALIVIERETGLEEIAETGVMVHARSVRRPAAARSSRRGPPLHDGAVIIRGDAILAAGALLPLAETTVQTERFGTRHRAALGIAEQTDAIVIVVSEENGQISLVERAPHRAQPQRGAARQDASACCSIRARVVVAAPSVVGVRRVNPRPRHRPYGRRGDPSPSLVVHNWPLKLAAVGLATLLYGGLVLSQSTATLTGVVPVERA